MAQENNKTESAVGVPAPPVEEIQRHNTDRRELTRARVAWWFKLFLQPLMLIAALVGIVFLFGISQRFGWFVSMESTSQTAASTDEDVQYVCPMMCVPPSSEPGNCPVCGMKLKARQASGDSKDKYGLTLDQASIRVANIRTVKAVAKPLVERIRAIGEIRYDEGSLATIAAYVDGRIEKLFADYTGVIVKKGDELALLYSPDLYSSQVAFIEAAKLIEPARSVNERIAESNRRLFESSKQRLVELGLTDSQVNQLKESGKPDSRIRIISPMAGTVIEKMADQGQYIKTGQAIYKVADLSTVWLMLELFPEDAAKISFGQRVTTQFQSQPGKEFVGRVAFVDPSVSPKTQTVRVRVVIPNESGVIRIGDFATASIVVSANRKIGEQRLVYDPDLVGKWISPRHPHVIRDGPGTCTECGMDLVPASELGFASAPLQQTHDVVVPRDAILIAGDHSVAYVETEPGRFEFRRVEVGQIVGDEVSVVNGLSEGELVASTAAFLIDSQFNMSGKPSLIDPFRAIPRDAPETGTFDPAQLTSILSDFSITDQEEILEQKICPVTEATLGSMGKPLPIEVSGRRIWICCAGCENGLRNDPEKHFATLDKTAALFAGKAKEIADAMAELPAEDRALAESQVTCPVAGEPLGSMGTPIKVDVDGQPVFICCEGCRTSLLKEPGKYLEILASGQQDSAPEAADLPRIQPLEQESPDTSGKSVSAEKEKSIREALDALPIEDRELAERQKICPVADMPLGSMGVPIKVDIEGQPVFICCEGCRESLLKEPARYLARLPGDKVK